MTLISSNHKKISIIGTVGIPASYGGFETLAENLASFHQTSIRTCELNIYCSARHYPSKPRFHLGARLRYIGLNANGIMSIPYDFISLFSALKHRSDVILLLGVSGALALPLVRLLSHARIITNIDGIEWKREKWKGIARYFLQLSEWLAIRFSHILVADNKGIAEYINQRYARDAYVIAYGGDHALQAPFKPLDTATFIPERFALALCRIEPENNISMILEAFASNAVIPLVFVGNWNNSAFGQDLRQRYADHPQIHLLDPIYDIGVLRTLRSSATIYVHGHSAGGTNPSLVEMMHFGLPILAFDCIFNRCTTENKAYFFNNSISLRNALDILNTSQATAIGTSLLQIARARYTWEVIGRGYFNILLDEKPVSNEKPNLEK